MFKLFFTLPISSLNLKTKPKVRTRFTSYHSMCVTKSRLRAETKLKNVMRVTNHKTKKLATLSEYRVL